MLLRIVRPIPLMWIASALGYDLERLPIRWAALNNDYTDSNCPYFTDNSLNMLPTTRYSGIVKKEISEQTAHGYLNKKG